MVAAITTLIRQCVEHGIWNALLSVQSNFEAIQGAHIDQGDVPKHYNPDSVFEYWILAFGLTLAALVFAVEVVLGG